MKTKFLFIAFCTYCLALFKSQSLEIPKIVPPSQETFALSALDFIPSTSGEYTHSIPLAEGMFSLPISLEYTSGVKVNDLGGSVGMSWQLNAGGVISRIVRDESDENNENWKPESVNPTLDLQKIRQVAQPSNAIDTEYDWFRFSLSNGIHGTFFIDEHLTAYVLSEHQVKITVLNKTSSPRNYGKLLEFQLVDQAGNHYFFGGREQEVESTIYNANGPDLLADTGWYLSKIKLANQREINFTYQQEQLGYYSSMDAHLSVSRKCQDQQLTYNGTQKIISTQNSKRPRILQITEGKKKILFHYTRQRKDLFENLTNQLLTKIEIFNDLRLTDSFQLDYFDILSLQKDNYYGLSPDETSTRYRHFLKSILNVEKGAWTHFQYDRPESLPQRFSLSADYYGYSNGKANHSVFPEPSSENNMGLFEGYVPLGVLTANRDVDPSRSGLGNLNKIIHPTKGTTEIDYETPSRTSTVEETHRYRMFLEAQYNTCNLDPNAGTKTFEFVSDGSPVSFSALAYFDDRVGCGDPDAVHDIHQLTFRNVSNNTILFSQTLKAHEPFTERSYNTSKNATYRIEYKVNSRYGAVNGNISIQYNSWRRTVEKTSYYGSARTKAVKAWDGQNSYEKKYYYTSLDQIATNASSLVNAGRIFIFANSSETSILCQSPSGTFPEIRITDYNYATTNNLINNFQGRNTKVFYSTITEVIEGEQAIQRRYTYGDDHSAYTIRSPEIPMLPSSNSQSSFQNGHLKSEAHYGYKNGAFELVYEKTLTYNELRELRNKSYVFKENFSYTPQAGEDPLINISYALYDNYYGFLHPTEITTTEYLEGGAIKEQLKLEYNSNQHSGVTKKTHTTALGEIEEITYQYAHEKSNAYLINKNIIGPPLKTIVRKKSSATDAGKIISDKELLYPISQSQAEAKTSGLPLPYQEQTYDLQTEGTIKVVSYDKYDPINGNLQQYTTPLGIPVAIVWGYNNTLPIAKVEGALYSELSTLIPEIVAKSNADVDESTQNVLLQSLDAFRKNSLLSGYLITTYSYDPLIGVTSITPPSGIREIYKYDSANRLEKVVDVNGNLLKKFKYNYKQ